MVKIFFVPFVFFLCASLCLKSESEGGADDVEVAGDADAVVLSQVIEVLGEVFVEDLDHAH